MAVIGAEARLYRDIRREASHDEARPAGAIVVFGAAQYNGAPSPVFKARLDHAFDLEERGLAPVVITTGGSGGDPHFTEAGVGQDYLVQRGTAVAKTLSEGRGDSTYVSAVAVGAALRGLHAKTCIVVSDGFHLYRVKRMLRAQGFTVYGSPAPDSPIEADPFARALYTLREVLSSTLWYVGYRG